MADYLGRFRTDPILIQKYRNELARTPVNDIEEDYINSSENLNVLKDVSVHIKVLVYF